MEATLPIGFFLLFSLLIAPFHAVSLDDADVLNKEEGQNFKFALGLFNDGLYDLAYRQLSDFLKTYPSSIHSSRASFLLGECLYRGGNYSEAIEAYNSMMVRYPESPFADDAGYRIGECWYLLKNREKAIEALTRFVQIHPHSTYMCEANYWLGESLFQLNRPDEALEHYRHSASIDDCPVGDYALYSVGWILQERGERTGAINAYENLIQNKPGSSLVHSATYNMAKCYFDSGEFGKTLETLTDFSTRFEKSSYLENAIFLRGEAFLNLKEFENARAEYERLFASAPGSDLLPYARYSIAWSYLQEEKLQDALREFTKGVTEFEENPVIDSFVFFKAECNSRLGNRRAAQQDYDKIVREFPESQYWEKAFMAKGTILFDNEDYGKAIETYLQFIEARQDSAAATELLMLANYMTGESYLALGQHGDALEYYSVVLSYDVESPLKAQALFQKGRCVVMEGNFSEAATLFERFYREYPDHERAPEARYMEAEAYYNQKEFSKAAELYRDIIKHHPDSGELERTRYSLAWALIKSGNCGTAIDEFKKLLQDFPESEFRFDAERRISDCYFNMKQYDTAIKMYNALIQEHPDNPSLPDVRYQLGLTYRQLGRLEESRTTFEKMVLYHPESAHAEKAQYMIAIVLFQGGQYEDAIVKFNTFTQLFPRSPLITEVIYYLGDCFYNLENYAKAEEYYRTILSKHSESEKVVEAITGIIWCRLQQEDIQSAFEVAEEFIQTHSESPRAGEVLLEKIKIYYDLKLYLEAEAEINRFLEGYPSSDMLDEIYYWKGKVLIDQHKTEEGIESFKELLKRFPESSFSPMAYYYIGESFLQQKEYGNAKEHFDKLVSAFPDHDTALPAYYYSGVCSEQLGEKDKALEIYREVAEKALDIEVVDMAHLELAENYFENSLYSEALLEYRNVIDRRNDELAAKAQYMTGNVYFHLRDYEKALLHYLKIKYLYPDFREWVGRGKVRAAECYIEQDKHPLARELLEDVVEDYEGTPMAGEASKLLERVK
jgi:TolA-binding protein